jgi:glycosyltransferase involved in cell wall biosynthesis
MSVIIPVKNNQRGIDCFLEAFFATHCPARLPKEIIIIDNNSDVAVQVNHSYLENGLPIRVLSCRRKGPAAARNCGVKASLGEWLLFCDSDCIPTASLLTGYLNSKKKAVAFAGNVRGTPGAYLSSYYDDEETLIPYRKYNSTGANLPLYVITANALVWKRAFQECGGFDESFLDAGGEDVDLGRRLWQIGNIEYEPNSLVLHDFSDGIVGLCKRYMRYGRGNRHLEQTTGIRMRPHLRSPRKKSALNMIVMLAQYLFMSIGYHQGNYRVVHGTCDGY